MTDREFLEQVELTLRRVAGRMGHEMFESRGKDGLLHPRHVANTQTCDKCRLTDLANEAADRAAGVAV